MGYTKVTKESIERFQAFAKEQGLTPKYRQPKVPF
jgi:hypothetical protein